MRGIDRSSIAGKDGGLKQHWGGGFWGIVDFACKKQDFLIQYSTVMLLIRESGRFLNWSPLCSYIVERYCMREDDQKKKKAPVIPNEKLKRERLRRHWTHAQLAELLAIADPRTISRWERGVDHSKPALRQKLCEVFGKSEEELGLLSTEEGSTAITNDGKRGSKNAPEH